MEEPVKIYVHETSALELDVKIPYSIEYIRKDAFIEKVLKYLDETSFSIINVIALKVGCLIVRKKCLRISKNI